MEQHGTKVERVRGGPCLSFWTNLVQQGAPKFDPGGARNGQNWPKMPQNGNFKVSVVQNGWNSVEQRWNGSKNFGCDFPQPIPPWFSAVPTVLDHRNLEIAIFWPFWANFGHFGRSWVKFRDTPLLEIGPETSAWTSFNTFHLRSKLFQPFWTTRTLKLPFLGILGQFGPFWAPGPNLGASPHSQLV